MKTEKQIKNKIKKLKSCEQYSYPSADVYTNAPLALIQIEIESNIAALEWVLKPAAKEAV